MDDGEQTRPPRVIVGMATGDYLHYLTALHYAGLIAKSREVGIEAIPSMNSGSMAPNNRSELARLTLQSEADALFMIDCDMMFPPLALAGLLNHGEDKDIIGGTYVQRQPNSYTHGFELDGRRIDLNEGEGIREVRDLPAGFILIRRRVLEAIRDAGDLPFFRFPYDVGADRSRSEDYDLCARARALGFKVWLDPVVSRVLGHIGTAIYKFQPAV